MLLQYGIDGQLLTAIKSLYMHSEVCVRGNSARTKPFKVSVGLRQGCSLSLILFLIYMDRIYEKLFGGTEFQNRFKKRRKHLLNLGSLEKDCF